MNKDQLIAKIKEAAQAYYNGSSIISDDEYDALIYELSLIDPKNELLVKVGAEPTEEWKKEKHTFPLGSLNKVNTPSEMSDWIKSTANNKPVVVMEKFDGLSLGMEYVNGKLTKAILRGNGEQGENIFTNVVKMQGCVVQLKDKNFTGTVRGEILLKKSNHSKHFPEYSNPRNAASGICRRLDSVGSEHLSIIAYDVMSSDVDFQTEEDKLKFIISNGFETLFYKVCQNSKQVVEVWENYQNSTRSSLDYEIDGLVITINDVATQTILGETNLRSKAKVAFKFANQFVKTTVKNIEFQLGNTGRLTPVCWFDKINLLGSNVEKASVYNVSYIEKIGLGIGAEVLVCKANEVIPRVERVVKPGQPISIPTECPSCSSKLETSGEYLFCPNTDGCPAQVYGRIENWITTLNVLEFGNKLIERLIETGKVKTIVDLYKLSVSDLASIDRMGERSAQKCYDMLHSNKEITVETLIGALSVPMIGVSMMKMVTSAGYDTLESIMNLSQKQLENINGLGPAKATSLYTGLRKNKDLINDLLQNGIKIKSKIVGKLNGMKIAITGSTNLKRAELEKIIAENGGEYKSSVGKGTTHLIISDINSQSSKAVSAKKLGAKLLTEEDFLKIVDMKIINY